MAHSFDQKERGHIHPNCMVSRGEGESHDRADWIEALGMVSFATGLAAILFAVTSPISITLGLAAWWLSGHDPNHGEQEQEHAWRGRNLGLIGALLGAAFAIFYGGCVMLGLILV
jgi:hypothetical protein